MCLFDGLFDFDGDGKTDAFEAGMGFSLLSSVSEGRRRKKGKKIDWGSFWLFVFFNNFFSSRRYKGNRSHLNGAGEFFVDLLCILYLTPLALLLVNHYEKRDARRASRMSAGMKSQGTAAPANKVNSVSDRNLKSSVLERQGASQTKTTVQKQSKSLQNNAEKKDAARIADPRIGSTSIDGSNKRCAPVHTMPTDEERRLELVWQAQQAARELEKQQTKDAEESRKAESDRKKREELRLAAADAIARLSEQIPDPTVANESSRESGDSVHNGGTYCGRIYVSRLMDFDDAEQAFCVPVPGENLQYSICWGNVPMPLRDILKEYCAVGGQITAKTEKSWINVGEYKLWVSLYLN